MNGPIDLSFRAIIASLTSIHGPATVLNATERSGLSGANSGGLKDAGRFVRHSISEPASPLAVKPTRNANTSNSGLFMFTHHLP